MLDFALTLAGAFHTGHGTTDPGTVRHYLIEPLHIVAILAALHVVVIGIWLWTARRSRRPS